MSSRLDLTVPGDVATISDDAKLSRIKLMDPPALYRLWERQNWSSHEIDLSRDRADWLAVPAWLRARMLGGLSAFFVGEERVTSQFSGLVLAAADKHEEAFLTTQQVDEARHAQYFNRLYEEVFAFDGDIDTRLARAREDLSPEYIRILDVDLADAHQALLAQPSSLEAKVDFVTVYHMVIEGMLALTGQHFHTRNLERRRIMAGHLSAFRLISQDEHRHVAYGTWFLQRHARDPQLAKRIEAKLAQILPAAGHVFAAPDHQRGADGTPDARLEATMNQFALTALSRRLKVIGVGPPTVSA